MEVGGSFRICLTMILNFKGVTSVKQVTEKVFKDGTREKVKDQVSPLFIL